MASEAPTQPRPIVICGPSGSGKSTILTRLFAAHPTTFAFSVSHTTRAPRGKADGTTERDGVDYHFVTPAAFEALIAADGFVEHAQFGGNRYGTSTGAMESIARGGRVAVLDIEVEGVRQLQAHREFGPRARCLFLSPPDLETLGRRLRGRGTDSEEAIAKRLARAEAEMAFGREEGRFERVVVNNDLETAYREVEEWVFKE